MPDSLNFEQFFDTSSAHRIDVRSKFITLLTFTVALFWIRDILGLFFAFVALMVIFFLVKVKGACVFGAVWPVYVLAALTLGFSSVTFDFGGVAGGASEFVTFNFAGCKSGVVICARFLLCVWSSMIFCLTTRPADVTFALSWFLRPLRALRVPVDDIAMVVSIAIRFIPLCISEFATTRDALLLRGAHLYTGGVCLRVKAWCAVFVALIIGLFRRADVLSQALDVRGYAAFGVARTSVYDYKFDAASLAFMCAACAISIALAVLF